MMIFFHAEAYFRYLIVKILEISAILVWHPLCIIKLNTGWFPVFSNIVVDMSVSTGKGTVSVHTPSGRFTIRLTGVFLKLIYFK